MIESITTAACADIPEFCVRNIGPPKIIQFSFRAAPGPEDSPTMMSVPSPGPRTRRTYDHRLREHVVRAGARSLGHSPATSQDILELWRRKCNKCEIAEEIAPWLICPASPPGASLTHAYLALP